MARAPSAAAAPLLRPRPRPRSPWAPCRARCPRWRPWEAVAQEEPQLTRWSSALEQPREEAWVAGPVRAAGGAPSLRSTRAAAATRLQTRMRCPAHAHTARRQEGGRGQGLASGRREHRRAEVRAHRAASSQGSLQEPLEHQHQRHQRGCASACACVQGARGGGPQAPGRAHRRAVHAEAARHAQEQGGGGAQRPPFPTGARNGSGASSSTRDARALAPPHCRCTRWPRSTLTAATSWRPTPTR